MDALDPADLRDDPFLDRVPIVEGYRVIHPCLLYDYINRGGFGRVYRAWHMNFETDVAVKCLRLDERLTAEQRNEAVSRFRREAIILSRLTHQNLVSVKERGQRYGLHYIVMDFVDGENARERRERVGERMEHDEALTIALGAARGLAAAHAEGILHRDVKPGNVMIARSGQIKVLDLGLAVGHDVGTHATASDQAGGTPSFMPPEQWSGLKNVDARGDVWSLGATLFYLLTGEYVATGPRGKGVESQLARYEDRIPPATFELIRAMTEKDPEGRPADGRELVPLLREALLEREVRLTLPDSTVFFEGVMRKRPTPAQVEAVRAFHGDSTDLATRTFLAGEGEADSRQTTVTVARAGGRRKWIGVAAGAVLLVMAGLALWRAFAPGDPGAGFSAAERERSAAAIESRLEAREAALAFALDDAIPAKPEWSFQLLEAYFDANPELARLADELDRHLRGGHRLRGLCVLTAPAGSGKSPLLKYGLREVLDHPAVRFVDLRKSVDRKSPENVVQLAARTADGAELVFSELPRLAETAVQRNETYDRLLLAGLFDTATDVLMLDSLDEVDRGYGGEVLSALFDYVRAPPPDDESFFAIVAARPEAVEAFFTRRKDPVEVAGSIGDCFAADAIDMGRVGRIALRFPEFRTARDLRALWESQHRFVDGGLDRETFVAAVAGSGFLADTLRSLALVEYALEFHEPGQDRRAFLTELRDRLLARGVGSHGRPGPGTTLHSPEETRAYYALLRAAAERWAEEAGGNEDLSFLVSPDDHVEVDGLAPVRAFELLDYSGLAVFTAEGSARRYAFLPPALHWILLVDDEWGRP